MKNTAISWLAAAISFALAGCGASEPQERQGLHIVGSSTVFPFAQRIAQDLTTADPQLAAMTVQSTGTGEGLAQFCAGAGLDTPDIANASRRMTLAEFENCQTNGVTEIVELQIGRDGIVFASAADEGLTMNLTPRIIYEALAAAPFEQEQMAANWSDVDSSLPEEMITVYGPPSSSGTRDMLIEMALEPGCETGRGMSALEDARYAEVCSTLRADSAYIDQGEADDVVVRKVAGNRRALAVFGYSFAEENPDQVKTLSVNDVEPNAATIESGEYPLSRPLYIYAKKSHAELIPGLLPYLAQWSKSWGVDGPLARIGLVAASAETQAASAKAASQLTVMSGEGLE